MRVYLDHNATSPLRPAVREQYQSDLAQGWGNASSVHDSGRRSRALIDEARERVAAVLGVLEQEVVFTSGGTEANNIALLGVLRAAGTASGLVTAVTEHPSVLEPAAALEREGHRVARLPVDAEGRVDLSRLGAAIEHTGARLVSLMAANNEIGTLGPLGGLRETLEAAPGERPLVHVDAVQALGRIPLELEAWGADLASFSAHKLGGPAGVGVLVRREGVKLSPIVHGGGQEGGLRSGTESPAALAAAALAFELAAAEQHSRARAWRALTESFWARLHGALPGARLLGPAIDAPDRLPNTINVLLPELDGRAVVARLDLEGLEVSAGSACASGSLEPSHVLLALGLGEDDARAGLRISFGHTNEPTDVEYAVETLSRTVDALRVTR